MEGAPPVASTSTASPPTAIAAPAQKSPTCFIFYGSRSVKARIDPDVPLQEVVRQLAASTQLAVAEPAALFALREKDTGVLVTEENLPRMLQKGNTFDLCSSPTIEAVEMVEKLTSGEQSVVKLATFSLRTLIKERAFLSEFIARGGLEALQEVIRRTTGNTVAYSLLSLQNLLELEENGWTGLERSFVARIVEIIATEPLINISRPATAILRRIASQSPSPPNEINSPNPNADYASGFAAVYEEISRQPNFLKIVIERLSSSDVPIINSSLALLNTLLRGSTELGDMRLADELETLEAWKAVSKLLAGTSGADLPTLLSLQTNLVAALHLALVSRVDTPTYGYFDEIWIASQLEDVDENNRWRRLGFKTESPQFEFDATGVLGLKALAKYASDSQNEFAATLRDQQSRPESRRCPVSVVSNTITFLLSSHFDLLAGVPQTPTVPNPYLFRFFELHALVVSFFLRMWHESGATQADYERVATLTKSQISFVCAAGGEKTWFKVRQEFLSADYRTVRDRQMREMEIEDDILSKAPVRNLRGRLYLESYEFVRSQRISCLHEGAWFMVAPPALGKKGAQQLGKAKLWRFYRLAANRKALHWVETSERVQIRGGLDDLPEKVDLALVTDIVASGANALQRPQRVSSAGPPFHRTNSSISHPSNRVSVFSKNSSDTALPPASQSTPASQTLSFTLHSADGPLVELIAPDLTTFSEWVDGLSLLRPDGSISTRDTADYIQALTDIGVKIKLLDLSGERVEIPVGITVSSVPRSDRFYYADSL
ncbi:hypothetical protein JCM10207_003565 [Rhodosporidiobolus poonsookiae]